MDPLKQGDPGQIGSYRLIGRLGAGGMGEVFLASSPDGPHVAIKLIRADQATTDSFRKRFAREISNAQRVGGRYTARVLDSDPHAVRPWMATAYIPGLSLHDRIAEYGTLEADDLRSLAAVLAEGLAAIHACSLVHRDLKPANVVLSPEGPRIIDFGIARALDLTAMTDTGTILGTYQYMSPEQVEGIRVGPASDIFSLGAVLAFAATGRPPFHGRTVLSIARNISSGDPDLTGVPEQHGLRSFIAECLAKDPEVRPKPAEIVRLLAPTAVGSGWPAKPSSGLSTPGATASSAKSPPALSKRPNRSASEPRSPISRRPTRNPPARKPAPLVQILIALFKIFTGLSMLLIHATRMIFRSYGHWHRALEPAARGYATALLITTVTVGVVLISSLIVAWTR